MTQEKVKRLIAAATAATILLIAVMLAVVIYQITEISILAGRRREIKQQIDYYKEQTETLQDDLEYLKSEQYLRDLALEQGFRFPD